MMSAFLYYVCVAAVIAVVSLETRALVHATQYALRKEGPDAWRLKVLYYRYLYESFLFHEVFMSKTKQVAAYSLYETVFMYLLMLCIHHGFAMYVGPVALYVWMGCATIIGTAFFAMQYGPNFVRFRVRLAEEIKAMA